MNKRKIINDPVHGFITIPHELLFDIMEHRYFQRLRRIKQLALSDYVYPGAHHTRFHHALGAMHLMGKALHILKIKGVKITEQEELGACVAILLHDIGHGPFSHTLEGTLIANVSHEPLSRLYMDRLNEHFDGQLKTAIGIFENRYPKKFLHQLVSSQLDVDRLDYLTRDSFFTGVSEGVISYNRIIEMMNVKKDQLVIEAKGIYSIEKFIISRRLMYWQVYLHKTVLCVEQMLVKTMERAKELIQQGFPLECSPALLFFLKHDITLKDFERDENALEYFSQLDDVDVLDAMKRWRWSEDRVLSYLCACILDRKLYRIVLQQDKFTKKQKQEVYAKVQQKFKATDEEMKYLLLDNKTSNFAYNTALNKINILTNDGKLKDISEVSDQLKNEALSEAVVKHYLCYPK